MLWDGCIKKTITVIIEMVYCKNMWYYDLKKLVREHECNPSYMDT